MKTMRPPILEISETENPNAIETHVCKKIEECEREPMSEQTSGYLIDLTFGRLKNKEAAKAFSVPEKEKPFLIKMIEGRLQLFTYTIKDFDLILFLAIISQTPGKAVMYLWYLQYWCKKNNVKELDLDILCERIFPMGFPSDETMHQIWDGQKVKGTPDNLVDYGKAGTSLYFNK